MSLLCSMWSHSILHLSLRFLYTGVLSGGDYPKRRSEAIFGEFYPFTSTQKGIKLILV